MLAKEKTMNMLQPSARIFFKKNQYHLKSSNAKDINQKKKKQCQAISEKGHQNMLVLQLNKKNPYKQ